MALRHGPHCPWQLGKRSDPGTPLPGGGDDETRCETTLFFLFLIFPKNSAVRWARTHLHMRPSSSFPVAFCRMQRHMSSRGLCITFSVALGTAITAIFLACELELNVAVPGRRFCPSSVLPCLSLRDGEFLRRARYLMLVHGADLAGPRLCRLIKRGLMAVPELVSCRTLFAPIPFPPAEPSSLGWVGN